MKLHTVCYRAGGMNRGGVRHNRLSSFDLEQFTPEQLRDMHREPELGLIVGGEELTEQQIAVLEKPATKAKG